MRIEVRTKGIAGNAGMREFVERRVRLALGRRVDQIERVQVWIEDVNGPKGGEDKRCRVRLFGPGLTGRVVESSGAEVGNALFDALERAGRLAHRVLGRHREHPTGTLRAWRFAT